MVEGQFVLKGVTQDTLKFYHVLGSLPETAMRGLSDLMRGLGDLMRGLGDLMRGRPHSHRVPEALGARSRQICCMTWCRSARTARRRPGSSSTCFFSSFQLRTGTRRPAVGPQHPAAARRRRQCDSGGGGSRDHRSCLQLSSLPGRRTWTGTRRPEPPIPRSRRRWRPSCGGGGGSTGGWQPERPRQAGRDKTFI
jgi:hypothetical protein